MKPAEPAILSLGRTPPPLSPEDQARADLYALIAALFLRAPDAAMLTALASADSLHSQQSDNPLDSAWEELVLAASLMDAEAVQEEFGALFISVGTPLLNPYGSLYLSGFMMEKPLATLRDDLRVLGLSRTPNAGEPEDHLGALCEAMRILIVGHGSTVRRSIGEQRTFFTKHIAPWFARCLHDIREAEGANFYRHVADFAQAFFEVELTAFGMEDAAEDDCEVC